MITLADWFDSWETMAGAAVFILYVIGSIIGGKKKVPQRPDAPRRAPTAPRRVPQPPPHAQGLPRHRWQDLRAG